MKEKYIELYKSCQSLPEYERKAQFVAMKGKYYDDSTIKFLVIGRAPYDWKMENTHSAEAFGEEAENKFYQTDRWNWVKKIGESLYNSDGTYCLSNKAFWSYAKCIWERIVKENEESKSYTRCPIWLENIAWSNLYKIAPDPRDPISNGNGNPSPKSQKVQGEICCNILKEEIQVLKPTHILLITGVDWAEKFISCFDHKEIKSKGKNINRGKNKNEIYVEGTARIGDAKVVIMCRPEYRNQQKYVASAIHAFNKLSKSE